MNLLGSYQYVYVSNLKRSADWYEEYLGFKLWREDPYFLDLRTDSGIRILLVEQENPNTQLDYGFVTSDVHSIYRRLKEKEIKVSEMTNYVGDSFRFHDPDGNLIEMWSDYPEGN